MATKVQEKETVWTMYECPTSGARWTSSAYWLKDDDKICTFSGCDCHEKTIVRGKTTDGHTAHEWFRRPQN